MLRHDGAYLQFRCAVSFFASLVILILGPCGPISGLGGSFYEASSWTHPPILKHHSFFRGDLEQVIISIHIKAQESLVKWF